MKRTFFTICLILQCVIITRAQVSVKPSDAQVLGFVNGVKSVEFDFQAGFGYTYHFDRDGQLTTVVYTDHGDSGKLQIKDGQVVQCDVVSEGYGEEEPTIPEFYHSTFSYQQVGDETIIYRTENQKQEQIGSLYYENGRISRVKSDGEEQTFMYNQEGRAFTQDGTEVYPPLVIFFSETPTLPRKHQVIKKDTKGRPLEAKAPMEVETYSGYVTYNILYWNTEPLVESRETFEVADYTEPPVQSGKTFDVVEKMPSYPGGNGALQKWIAANIAYPAASAENVVEGRVIVAFIVDVDGSVTDVRIARGIDPALDQEALRVVKSMPKWIPGMQDGKPVRVKFNVPVTFKRTL